MNDDRIESNPPLTPEVQDQLLSEYDIENPPKIYCPSMWKSVHVDVDSYLTPCCVFINAEDKKTKITDLSDNESIESVLSMKRNIMKSYGHKKIEEDNYT